MKLLGRFDVFLMLDRAFISMLGYITLLFSLSDMPSQSALTRTQANQIIAFWNLGTACGWPFIGSSATDSAESR